MIDRHSDLPLWLWEASRPTAEIVDLSKFRESSPRWILEIRPRETAEQAVQAFMRLCGELPTPSLAQLGDAQRRKQA